MAMTNEDLFVYRELTPEDIESYLELGYFHYGRVLTDRGLELLIEQCMVAWDRDMPEFDPDKPYRQNSQISNLHHESEVLRRYYFNGPIVDAAVKVIGPNIKAVTDVLLFKMAGNPQPTEWHQDNIYGELSPYNAISCLTALDDSTLENGCTWLIPRSHKQGQIEFSYTSQEKSAQKDVDLEVDESESAPLVLKAGECAFLHCHILHRGGSNKSTRHRRLIFTRYADADAVEAYNNNAVRLGKLLRGTTKYAEVRQYEAELQTE